MDEPLFTDENKWDAVATLGDQLLTIHMQIETITLAASALGEVAPSLLALRSLTLEVWQHYRARANQLVPEHDQMPDDATLTAALAADPDYTLARGQFEFFWHWQHEIKRWLHLGKLADLNNLAGGDAFKTLFAPMEFDEAWDRFGCILDELAHPAAKVEA